MVVGKMDHEGNKFLLLRVYKYFLRKIFGMKKQQFFLIGMFVFFSALLYSNNDDTIQRMLVLSCVNNSNNESLSRNDNTFVSE